MPWGCVVFVPKEQVPLRFVDGGNSNIGWGIAFELGIFLIALLLGMWWESWPLESLDGLTVDELRRATVQGVLATVPMLALLLAIDSLPFKRFQRLRRLTSRMVNELFDQAPLLGLATISVAAGLGEEALFRGLIQNGLSDLGIGPALALVLASFLFGLCHWVTRLYAILAFAVSVYLGVLFLVTDQLLVPIITHTLYDFFALVYLTRWNGRGASA